MPHVVPLPDVCVIGVDVAKDHLDFHVLPDEKAFRVPNTPAALQEAVKTLAAYAPQRIVMESTGGYERMLLEACLTAKLPAAMVNPARVRHYARAAGQLAKNDPLDARINALFGQHLLPRVKVAREAHQQALKDLCVRRRQLTELVIITKNQREHACLPAVKDAIARTLLHLKTELAAMEALIQEHIAQDATLQARYVALQEIAGIGPKVASVLVTDLPELGHVDRQAIAKLVGVAPMDQDSGRQQGARHIQGGRVTVRRMLYMAALVGVRRNEVIKAYYHHLKAQGKPHKVAIVACMRKLLVHANATLAGLAATPLPEADANA